MRKFSRKQYLAAGAAAVIIAGGAGVAFAYWTNSGSGSGSADTGTNSAITVNQTNDALSGGLVPGGSAQQLSGDFTNGNSSPVYVHQVTVSIRPGFSEQADTDKPACMATDFDLVQPDVTDAEVASGANTGSWDGASISLRDETAFNQDNCKNVTVPLDYSSN